ncbi:hypothetical protein DUNSADRAFT_3782 [Dunaliella salina]|uniref:BTB domain-containing protein n=1 Tax=Dunaliella salina TaxID=3046 RepID=A0ABQ7FV61_DUNSA|nr:hypothetical protein DUNSADRAFT_3782 [Dunaliella salina]|eukprot:KAF5826279.1 hypothetical protein DUNSADRAFT_3782 [Dunaliella salina]
MGTRKTKLHFTSMTVAGNHLWADSLLLAAKSEYFHAALSFSGSQVRERAVTHKMVALEIAAIKSSKKALGRGEGMHKAKERDMGIVQELRSLMGRQSR